MVKQGNIQMITTKMIVMDLDDTLLNDGLTIESYTKQVIKNAHEHGIRIIIASGRPTSAIMNFSKELELEKYNGFVISYNGAVITDCVTEENIFEKKLSINDFQRVCDLAKEKELFIHTYLGNEIFTSEMNEYTDFEGRLTGMPVNKVNDLKSYVNSEVIKTLILGDPAKLKQVETEVQPILGNDMSINISKPFFLEFTNKKVDKSKTIDVLIKALGIEKNEVMAIGDSYNDLTMIKDCGIGVVMDNAPEDVKEHADFITHSNNYNGVATAINRYALGV